MTYNKHALEVCHRRSCDIYNKQNSFHNINDDAGKVILLISSLFAVNELKLLNVSEIHTRTFTGQFLNLRRKNIFLTTWDDSGFIGRFVFTCRGTRTVVSIRRRKNHFNQNRFKYLCCCLKWLLPWCRCRTPAGTWSFEAYSANRTWQTSGSHSCTKSSVWWSDLWSDLCSVEMIDTSLCDYTTHDS